MRTRLLLPLPLALLLLAPSATAAEWNVEAFNFRFSPANRQVAVGDTVTWRFTDDGHSATSRPGQGEQWDSGTRGAGAIYKHTFTRPGRYEYVCTPHESFMTGVIEVGGDAVARTMDGYRTKRRKRSMTVSFTLNEPARASYKVRGATRRSVNRGRLPAGSHRIRVKRLKKGRHNGTLTLTDDFDNKVVRKNSFRIR
jgi:plastocyanin